MVEQCVLCGISATVRVGGTSFCAACGVSQYSNAKTGRAVRRGALFTVLSSSMLLKTFLGAVAVAAVSGVAAATVVDPGLPPAPEEPVVAQLAAETTLPNIERLITETTLGLGKEIDNGGMVSDEIAAFVLATEQWLDCVVSVGSTGDNPIASCGSAPDPADFDIGIDDATVPNLALGDKPGDEVTDQIDDIGDDDGDEGTQPAADAIGDDGDDIETASSGDEDEDEDTPIVVADDGDDDDGDDDDGDDDDGDDDDGDDD